MNSRLVLPSVFASLLAVWAVFVHAFAGAAMVLAQPPIEGYTNYDALAIQLKTLNDAPTASVTSLGKSLGGREIFLITIAEGDPKAKPAILIVGNVDAAHLVHSELAMALARHLAGPAAEATEATKELFERFTFYIIPRPDPDASEHFFARPSIERTGNDRPTDDDRDGETDEDPPQDLDSDGAITMMRVEDEGGEFIPFPADSRVMIKADPRKNERGRYRLYTEGRDDDGDGAFNEDPPGGVSFNRNFPHGYAYFEPLSGPHQVSEIESRGVADFSFAQPNIALVFTFSPEDNLMEPWKPSQGEAQRARDSIAASDAPYVAYMAQKYRDILGAKDAPSSPSGAGSFSRWAYFQYGRWSLASRAWWIPKADGRPAAEPAKAAAEAAKDPADADQPKAVERRANAKSDDKDRRGVDDAAALAWFEREGIAGFVDWKPYDHPDFPGKKVEIGGFKPYLRINPPFKEIAPLAEKHAQFLAQIVDWMPRAKIARASVEPLGGGVYRLTAEVLNSGYLPTMPDMGRTTGEAYPLVISLELPEGVKLLTGNARTRLQTLSGGGKAEHVWLLMAPATGAASMTLAVRSPSVTGDRKSVELK